MIKNWLNDFNTTSYRIFISIHLAVVQVFALDFALWRGWSPTDPQKFVLIGIAGGILTMMGFDVVQFWAKRSTDVGYAQAKSPNVNVEAPSTVKVDSNVNMAQERPLGPGTMRGEAYP